MKKIGWIFIGSLTIYEYGIKYRAMHRKYKIICISSKDGRVER